MAFSNLSSAQVGRLIALIKKKESLQAKLSRIDGELQSIESAGNSVTEPKRRGRKPGYLSAASAPGKPGRRGKRGKRLKDPLLKALQAAGASGVTVKELAAQLKVKPGNIFSWFYTTGKKVKGIKKVGEAKYAYTA